MGHDPSQHPRQARCRGTSHDPLLANIGGLLRRFQRAEAWLRHAGLPSRLARAPMWVLCLQYCMMMRGKTTRIAKVGERIGRWLETITALSTNEKARLELLDMDCGMRNDIESTKRTLLQLRELCVDVGSLFGSIGFTAAILDRTQGTFLQVVDESCSTATTLQRALQLHDERALLLLRQMQDAEREPALAGSAGGRAEGSVNAPEAGHNLAQPAKNAASDSVKLAPYA
jgi:hypothetical protein